MPNGYQTDSKCLNSICFAIPVCLIISLEWGPDLLLVNWYFQQIEWWIVSSSQIHLKKHLDIFFFSQNRCRSKPNLSGLHAFRLKGIICFNLQRISPTKVFSLGIFKLFRFKGETMTNFRKLLPNWPISWRFSGLLIIKGNILEKTSLVLVVFQIF